LSANKIGFGLYQNKSPRNQFREAITLKCGRKWFRLWPTNVGI